MNMSAARLQREHNGLSTKLQAVVRYFVSKSALKHMVGERTGATGQGHAVNCAERVVRGARDSTRVETRERHIYRRTPPIPPVPVPVPAPAPVPVSRRVAGHGQCTAVACAL